MDDDIISLVTYYQIMQCIDSSMQEFAWSAYYETGEERLDKLIKLAKSGNPACLMYYGHEKNSDTILGHAVVAYGYEQGIWEWDEQTYDARVLIYDPNSYVFEDTCCLYLDNNTKNWIIPAYHLNSEHNDWIAYVSDDIEFLNNCGLYHGTHYQSDKDHFAFLRTMKIDGEYSCFKTLFDGNDWIDVQDNSDIRMFNYSYGKSLNSFEQDFMSPDLKSCFSFKVEKEQPLDITMNYDGLLMATEGTAQYVDFSPDGICAVHSSGQPYTLHIISNDNYPGNMPWFDISGNASSTQVQKTKEGYLIQSDNLENVTVYASGNATKEQITFSTDKNEVLIKESDHCILNALIDQDNDGTFETAITKVSDLGDVNQDGYVNASDATSILIDASYYGTMGRTNLTNSQYQAGDINQDGYVNAIDATAILRYAAAVGNGNVSGKLECFLRSKDF